LDVYIRPKTITACIGYALYSQNFEKSALCFCYKLVYNTLPLVWVNHQQSRFKVKIDVSENPSF